MIFNRSISAKTASAKTAAKNLFLIASAVGLANCGDINNNSGLIQPYTYPQFVDQSAGCITPPAHSVGSRDALCITLTNDRANLDPRTGVVCATSLRQNYFSDNCPGYTWPTSN